MRESLSSNNKAGDIMKIIKIKDLKVGKKLILSYGIIIFLYVVTVVTSILGISETSNTMDTFYEQAFEVTYTAAEMKAAIQGVGRNMLDVLTGGISEEQRMFKLEECENYIQLIDDGDQYLQDRIKETELLETLADALEDVRPYRTQLMQLLNERKYETALDVYNTGYEPNAQKARDTLQAVTDYTVVLARECIESGHEVKEKVISFLLMLAGVCLLITILLCTLITKSIITPVSEISQAAEELSRGNLEVDLPYESKDELGDLASSVRETVTALRSYVAEMENGLHAIGNGKLNYQTQVEFKGNFVALADSMNQITKLLGHAILKITNAAEQVAGGAEQMAGGAQILSQGAVEQAGSMEELAANINEISDSVRTNAADSVNAKEKVLNTSQLITENSHEMEVLMKAIKEIRDNSKSIGGLVKEIEDIAFQTNILALNASVEAARAGDAGKGFSVVANEIRHLSVKTTEASRVMANLAEQTTEKILGGEIAANRTAQALSKVIDSTQEIISVASRISDASVRQADSIIQIRQSIEQVSDIVQGNSATAEESAAASEELSAQAQVLMTLVEEFELS